MKIMFLCFLFFPLLSWGQTCRYSYTVWNTKLKRSEGPILVNKPYSSLQPSEIGPRGCTPCEVDQEQVVLSDGMRFKGCKHFTSEWREVLNRVIQSGQRIESMLGYRPSISKGAADAQGRRTELSHHAFGAALDINENHNGLYTHCLNWSKNCVLTKGGAYVPGHPLSLTEDKILVKEFEKIGLKWGGKIQGDQKDFMHFSLDGY